MPASGALPRISASHRHPVAYALRRAMRIASSSACHCIRCTRLRACTARTAAMPRWPHRRSVPTRSGKHRRTTPPAQRVCADEQGAFGLPALLYAL
nr:MAG TPA: hypothetical protein [Inoviridae sp.]